MYTNTPHSFNEWFQKDRNFIHYETKEVREAILMDLDRLRSMAVNEYILWQKWEEINAKFPKTSDNLFGEPTFVDERQNVVVQKIKNNIWNERNFMDIHPTLTYVNDWASTNIREEWTTLRYMIHSQQHAGAIGRNLNFIVEDKPTGKYLGLISIASDFLDIKCRDEHIGWTREQRTKEQRIKYTAVCSTLVPVQPFGFNYTGGKLLALLATSNVVRLLWKNVYGDELVGLTTTSLFGKSKNESLKKKGKGLSQYDNLMYWKRMGFSAGSTPIRLSLQVRSMVYEWAKEHMPQEYFDYRVVTRTDISRRDRFSRFFIKVFQHMHIGGKLYFSHHDRGIYFSEFYTRTNEFLRNESKDYGVKRFDDSIENLTEMWKYHYAEPRYEALCSKHNVSYTGLFYDDLATMTWEEARKKYLKDVGR